MIVYCTLVVRAEEVFNELYENPTNYHTLFTCMVKQIKNEPMDLNIAHLLAFLENKASAWLDCIIVVPGDHSWWGLLAHMWSSKPHRQAMIMDKANVI